VGQLAQIDHHYCYPGYSFKELKEAFDELITKFYFFDVHYDMYTVIYVKLGIVFNT